MEGIRLLPGHKRGYMEICKEGGQMGLEWLPDLFLLAGVLQYLGDKLLQRNGFHSEFLEIDVCQNLKGSQIL